MTPMSAVGMVKMWRKFPKHGTMKGFMDYTSKSDKVCAIEFRLHLNAPRIPSWLSAVLQAGFGVEIGSGVTVKDFLCRDLSIDPLYVAERVTTIFVDGKCVDNVRTSLLGAGSTLALSSSMPGLAGAAIRSGSPLGLFRGPVTYDGGQAVGQPTGGVITVKLFNVLIDELGPIFLAHGILLGQHQALQMLETCAGSSIALRLGEPRNR